MRRLAAVLSLALVAVVVATGCAAAPQAARDMVAAPMMDYEAAIMEEGLPPPPMAPQEPGASFGQGGEAARAAYQAGVPAERMIIRSANVSIVVRDTDAVLDSLRSILGGYGGYVAESSQWYSDEQLHANLTMRVPSESLDAFLEDVAGLAVRVPNQNVSSDDVTEEYVDLQARLRNLEATEEELRVLLTEVRESRSKAEDILAVHRELTNIRSQIESLQGRRNYLERMTALSTVRLQIRPEAAPRTVIEQSWNPLVTTSNAARTLVSIARWVFAAIIYVVVLSPLVLLPMAGLWLLARIVRRRKRTGSESAGA